MEILLRIITWVIQIIAVFLIPACLIWYVFKRFSKRNSIIISAVIVVATMAIVGMLATSPPVIVPQEYEGYIDEQTKDSIQAYNSGLYSMNIPVFPIYITVTYADDNEVEVTTYYYPYGNTIMSIGDDGPSLEKGLGD